MGGGGDEKKREEREEGPNPFSVPPQNTSTIWRKVFTDISVRAPFIRHRNKLIILQYKRKPTNRWMARERSIRSFTVTWLKSHFIVVQNNKASLKCSKDKADFIEDVYSCIRANAHQLTQFPELVPQLCLNEPDKSYSNTLAQVSQCKNMAVEG